VSALPWAAAPMQRSFDDLGTALVDTTFCVFDLETTGGSPESCRITEVGAVKVRGGAVLGEFQSLVDPGVPIPPAITMLTGITDLMVAGAEPVGTVLPAFLEFAGGATLVAHNASFDTRFVAANLVRHGYAAMENPVVCTVRLARRLVRDEVRNLKLDTLAHALRARTAPSHRALADARATTDVFHALLERCGGYGVTHLDDLLWFQSARGHPSYAKVTLAQSLPRARGVYLFRGDGGRVLYVGKAADLRARVRSYFGGDQRKRVDDLLREVRRVDHVVCASDLEAAVVEARLIRAHAPRYNRAQRGTRARWFLRLTGERFPRLTIARAGPGLGPMSRSAAVAVKEALEAATELRTCTARLGARPAGGACVRGQIGRCPAPCERAIDPKAYGAIADPVARALDGDPSGIVASLARRMAVLAREDRFEEAAETRARLEAVIEAARWRRETDGLLRARRLVLGIGGSRVEIAGGFVATVDDRPPAAAPDDHPDEPRLVAGWLARNRARVRVLACDEGYAMPLAAGSLIARWRERLKRARDA